MAQSAVLLLLLLAAGAAPPGTLAARILALLPFTARSHFIVTSSLPLELAEHGHEVHVVSQFKVQSPPANYTEITIQVPNNLPEMRKCAVPASRLELGRLSPVGMLGYMWGLSEALCRAQLNDPAVRRLISDKTAHYDLVLIEAFINECFLGFAHRFRAPVVQLSSTGGLQYMGDWVGDPDHPAYVTDFLLDYTGALTFGERLANTLLGLYQRLIRTFYYLPRIDAVMREAFADPDMPSVADLERNTSLMLVNSHFSIQPPRPAVPAYVQVGGLHIKPPKPLPADLRAWLDAAADGFIYFSLGSVTRGADLSPDTRDAFVQAFAGLEQRVLWKWEGDAPPGLPANVRLAAWLPQQDVLAHPSIRLFITHGGYGSTVEAVYHGVPLLGIPLFGDQRLNVRRAEAAGYALALPFAEVSLPRLSAALDRLLGEPAFRHSARRRSAHFHDRPRPPLQEALWWTEYVLRHRGARHLRSAAADLGWAQLLLLDVGAALAAAGAAAAAALALAACALRRCLRRRRSGPAEAPGPKGKARPKRD